MIRKRKNKSHAIVIGSFLILVGLTIPLSKNIYEDQLNRNENKKIEKFFKDSTTEKKINNNTIEEKDLSERKNENESSEYIGILEIPSISFKRGFVAKNDKSNNISENIQILKESDMPDVNRGNFIIAGHSGSGRIAFFKNLHCVKFNDLIHVYYNQVKYTYRVVDFYIEPKVGNIHIYRNNEKTTLTLTTCNQDKKDSQIVIISELVDSKNF